MIGLRAGEQSWVVKRCGPRRALLLDLWYYSLLFQYYYWTVSSLLYEFIYLFIIGLEHGDLPPS